MIRESLPTFTDDAGNRVGFAFHLGPVERRNLTASDPAFAELCRQLRSFHTRRGYLEHAIGYVFVALAVGLVLPVVGWVLGPARGRGIGTIAGFVVLFATAALVLRPIQAREARRQVPVLFATVLARGRCPNCGYVIASIPPDDDGLVACAECGAKWRSTRVLVDHHAAMRPASSVLDGRVRQLRPRFLGSVYAGHTVDARNIVRRVVSPARRKWSESTLRRLGPSRVDAFASDCRRASALLRIYLPTLLLVAGLSLCVWSFTSPWGARLTPLGGRDPALRDKQFEALFLGNALILAGAVGFVWSGMTVRSLRKVYLRHSICPACLGDLTPMPARAGEERRCPECGAVWRTEQARDERVIE